MSYISLSKNDINDMLTRIGISSIEELFATIPDEVRLKTALKTPQALCEPEVIQYFKKIASKNYENKYISFLGAGTYSHITPVIVDYLSSRGEFISPYTPYQPEVSQGTLQIIFEFQTLICQLTKMDIANASMYDGATGAAEAALMAFRLKRRSRILISAAVHPQYRQVIQTYIKNMDLQMEEIPFSPNGETNKEILKEKLDADVAAVICQSPNFFGVVENLKDIFLEAKNHQALSVGIVAEPMSLGLLAPPGLLGADIVTGEAQSFGVPPGFGGPHVGFMACSKDFIRQFPGRISGQTKDKKGRRGYVLTLSTREQHIRRERATSNICTNQAWCALRVTIFLQAMGKQGLKEMAIQNIQKANFAMKNLTGLKGVSSKFSGKIFNEFVLEFEKPWHQIKDKLKNEGIIGGIGLEQYYPELKNCALFCVTEFHKRQDIDRLIAVLGKAAQ